jgi:hypothetical protein
LWEMCSYLPQCSANFAMETLYWSCLGPCQHRYHLGQYILILVSGKAGMKKWLSDISTKDIFFVLKS